MRSCGPLCPPLQNKNKKNTTNQRTGAFSYSQTSRFCLTFPVILLSTSPQNGTRRVPVQRENTSYCHIGIPVLLKFVHLTDVVSSTFFSAPLWSRCSQGFGVFFFFLPLNSSLVVYNPAEARHKKRPFRHQSLSSSVPFFSSFHLLFWNKNFLNFFFFFSFKLFIWHLLSRPFVNLLESDLF